MQNTLVIIFLVLVIVIPLGIALRVYGVFFKGMNSSPTSRKEDIALHEAAKREQEAKQENQ